MNDNNNEIYYSNSRFYHLPVKEPWSCGKTLYSTITLGSATFIGLVVSRFFTQWLFNNTAASSTNLINSFYTIFALFAPFLLFCSCIYSCLKYNKKLFNTHASNQFKIADILHAIQTICISFLKTALIYFLIAIFSSPLVLIIIILFVGNSIFKLFR